MKCPKCGSENVSTQVTNDSIVSTKTKGFGFIKSCLGFFLFNIPGLLCGFCGMGKGKTTVKSQSKVIHICQNCGKQW
ncbi:hypothetical protein AALC25_15400 [Lachnospiraceae bacterium 29-84]